MIQTSVMMVPGLTPFVVYIPSLSKNFFFNMDKGFYNLCIIFGTCEMRLLNQMLNLNIPLFKTKSRQRTFFYRIVSLWNSLDNSLKLFNSARNFKRKLRAELFSAFLSYRSQFLSYLFIAFFKVSVSVVILLNIYLFLSFRNFFYYKTFYYCNFQIYSRFNVSDYHCHLGSVN